MRNTKTLSVAALVAALLAGCASGASSSTNSPGHRGTASGMAMPASSGAGMPAGMVMPDGSTMAPGSPGTAPSSAARMICTDETRDNIATVLAVPPDPKPASTWSGGTYTCTYRLPMGAIVLSVHESADVATAAAYTAGVRKAMPTATDLAGLTQTAFGTPDGVVVLRKDNDTLRVDTSALRPRSDRLYAHRAAFAYEIAAVIMGCWTGG